MEQVIFRLETAQESRSLNATDSQLLRDLKHQVLGWAAIEGSHRRQKFKAHPDKRRRCMHKVLPPMGKGKEEKSDGIHKKMKMAS